MSTTFQIAEAAERSGFPPSTLRYYESIGLLPAPARTEAGYRAYDDDAMDRLAFIARAKQLGCTLDETTELLAAWEGDQCAPVQSRLRQLVADKVTRAQQQIAEMMTLTAQLQRAAATLEQHTPDGPCDDTCGCTRAAGRSGDAVPVPLASGPTEQVPIACTMEPSAMPDRMSQWQHALASVVSREAIDGGVRLQLEPDAPVAELAQLAAAEWVCCSFFSFALTVDARGTALEVRAPADAADIVTSLFGAPT